VQGKGGSRIKAGRILAAIGWLSIVFAITLSVTLLLRLRPELFPPSPVDPNLSMAAPLDLAALPTARRFDFPIGTENGAFAYNAQPFTQNRHLGDDLNGIGGENSDLGDPIFAVADGWVLLAREGGPGWGKIVILLHAYEENGQRKYVQSYYAHVQTILVRPRQTVKRGEKIATIGTGEGRYFAHLHFEMRTFVTPFIGPGYREDTWGWLNPSEFILKHRGAPDDDIGRPTL
jgi:murein DD-endopeptidase MepM/ murein hydrolase activator NlpD